MSAVITISFYTASGFLPGDYVKLHGNSGSGDINWDTPLIDSPLDLFPDGAGVYGFGCVPFGNTPFGRPYSVGVAGWGRLPFGKTPFGYGAVKVSVLWPIYECGDYKFGFASYNAAGNKCAGSPEEILVSAHITPPAPTGLRRNNYDKDTDVLVLDAL